MEAKAEKDDQKMSQTKKRWVWAAGAVLLIALGGAGIAMRRPEAPPAPPAAEQKKTDTLAISAAALKANPIHTTPVQLVKLAADLQVVGSVSYDQDNYAVVGPLLPGRVARLRVGVGDAVKAGQVLAEIESSDVGQAQATFLSARARARAAAANARRERDLASQKISSERDREVAEAAEVSEDAELRAATERLRAFGLSAAELKTLDAGAGTGGRVSLRAPIAGTVVARAVTLGQAVERATDAFKIVDLQHLWVLLDLYEKDLERVHVDESVEIRTESLPGEVFRARVAYINPIIDPQTRTANVRIEFDNPKGKLRPGQFVSAKLVGDPKWAVREVLAVPRKAVQAVEGKSLVFVKTGRGFDKRVVELGGSGGELVEIRKGLDVGEEVATDGAFLLKSELLR